MGINEILTVKEAAKLLKTSWVQICKIIKSGELLAVMVGREYRIPVNVIRTFMINNLQ
ncbi:helix-turn-helix domain-containing protein [Butyricicoccus sp. 1XD8-22]|nr:helix-turn-helix domain-containing protein [Butyricicoccus sp. 1XD8-22]